MTSQGLARFKGKKVVLLQGPVGPFFRRFAEDLVWAGAQVCKINFNGGDWFFYPTNCTLFRGTSQEWPAFFEAFLIERNIDHILLFGDCRSIHVTAHEVARRLGVEVGVFEEGYVRPDYITLEKVGVNARSALPRSPLEYLNSVSPPVSSHREVGQVFGITALWAVVYYAASHALRPFFPHYQHHRPLNIWEGLYWLRSFWRRRVYKRKERKVLSRLCGALSGNYFLVPLQVPTDSQVLVHSEYQTMGNFISAVLHSFATHAPPETVLVFKHHPLDRGYNDYAGVIFELSKTLGVSARVLYIHDQPLAQLIDHSIGVVVVNSTVGFSAVHHLKPVKTCGIAFYDMHGLTFQGTLDEFWKSAPAHQPDAELYRRFREFVIRNTQINGNFYKRLKVPGMASGLVWDQAPREGGTELQASPLDSPSDLSAKVSGAP